MFKLRSQSAGNNLTIGTSEILRSGIVVNSENVKSVSIHAPKHVKPLNDEQLGHYLAGLIDGDGHFSKQQQLVLVFSSPDAFLAHYLKTILIHCNVRKVKDKKAYLLIVSKKEGILNILNLINGKLRTNHRFNQAIDNILNNHKYSNIKMNFTKNNTNDFNNHWLAGFADADGSFQIKTLKRPIRNKMEVRLNFQIDQKSNQILKNIKDYIGGNIGYRESQGTYYYGSTSFGSAKNVINYFDIYHLQSRKYISYLRWRKVYILIQNKEHLTEKGLVKVLALKHILNNPYGENNDNDTTI